MSFLVEMSNLMSILEGKYARDDDIREWSTYSLLVLGYTKRRRFLVIREERQTGFARWRKARRLLRLYMELRHIGAELAKRLKQSEQMKPSLG